MVEKKSLSSGVLPSRQHLWYAIYTEGVAPGYYLVVPSRHRSADGVLSVIEKNPEDRGGADTQVAPVGRLLTWLDDKRMGGI